MGTGLSMASINKIKELAESHEYSLAAPILDSQDLEKSYNPQFLRLCGEIYENVGRLSDARALYVKAHAMAPEATRIIFSLMEYYLKIGYFDLAERYFEEYVHFSNGDGRELSNVRYIMKKAKAPDLMELYDLLFPYYRDNMDEKWSFELLLLTKLLDKGDMDIIASDYKASFKTSAYRHLVDDVVENKATAWDNFFIYAEEPAKDDDPADEEIRKLEQQQLEQDYKIINPPEEDEAVITSMVSENEDEPSTKIGVDGVEKGIKRFIKKRFKKIKEEDENPDNEEELQSDADITDEDDSDRDVEAYVASADATEVPSDESTDSSEEATEETEPEASEEMSEEAMELKEALDDIDTSDFVTYEFDDGFAPESETIAGLSDVDEEFDDSSEEVFNAFKDFALYQDDVDKNEDFVPFDEESSEEYEAPEEYDSSEEEFTPEVEEDIPELEEEFTPEVKEDIPELEEEFTPEVEKDVPELEEESTEEVNEPLDESTEEVNEPLDESAVEPYSKSYEEQLEDEFVYGGHHEEETATSEETVSEQSIEDEISAAIRSAVENYRPNVETPTFVSSEEEFVPEVEEEVPELAEEPTYSSYTEPVREEVAQETFVSEAEQDIRELEEEPAIDFVPEVERPEYNTYVEHIIEEPVSDVVEKPVSDVVEEPVSDVVEEPVSDVVEESVSDAVEGIVEEPIAESTGNELVPAYMKADVPSIDFARFGSDLFPGLNKQEIKVENRFNEVIKTESEKLDEGLKEEEAKLKEAEALLASLGIKL
ncbi:MAG: hypothetical protein ILA13_08105 [Eubacterium sp.]|nr:hypothetical protein [Eubacterium sp.]